MKTGKTVIASIAALLFGASEIRAQDSKPDPANDKALAALKDPDMDVRIAALRQLQTSLDPRIPEALLPRLGDEGHSIRRLAARGVGSRWHQVPKDRVPAFVAALEPLVATREDHFAVANMAERAIGLLTRKYEGDMFLPSPDEKWIVYERYGLPCLIDVERGNEELIGWRAEDSGGWFSPAWSNSEVADAGAWEAKSRAVALEIITSRRSSTFWFWKVEGSQLSKIESDAVFQALKVNPDAVFYPAGFFTSALGWKDDEFQFQVFFTVESPDAAEEMIDQEKVVGWNLESGALREVPKAEQLPDPEDA